MENQQIVIFKLNQEDFGISVSQVNEIIKPVEIFKVPDVPNFIEGLINLRGKVYTVFNLRKKFHLPAVDFDESTKIIIVTIENTTVGFIVDDVNEILWIDEENIEDTPDTIATPDKKYLNGVIKKDGQVILLLDLKELISQAELEGALKKDPQS